MGKLARAIEKAIFQRDKEICQICGRKIRFDDGEIDHILSKHNGGNDNPENLQWVCHRCNKIKGKDLSNKDVRKLLLLPEKLESAIKTQKNSPTRPKQQRNNRSKLKHSKLILLTRNDYQGLDQWSEDYLVENLLEIGLKKESREISCLMEHFKTGYLKEIWNPLMNYKCLIDKYGRPSLTLSSKGFSCEFVDFETGQRKKQKRSSLDQETQIFKLREDILEKISDVIFSVKNGIPLEGSCKFCP